MQKKAKSGAGSFVYFKGVDSQTVQNHEPAVRNESSPTAAKSDQESDYESENEVASFMTTK